MRDFFSAEPKFFDTEVTSTTISAAGNIYSPSLNLITQGDTGSSRDGRLIHLTGISINFFALLPNTTTASQTADMLRIIVYVDKQSNGAAATVAGDGNSLLSEAGFLDHHLDANVHRFDILMEKFIDLSAPGGLNSRKVYHFKLNKKLDYKVLYSGNTGTITDVVNNNLGVLAITFAGHTALTMEARLYFVG